MFPAVTTLQSIYLFEDIINCGKHAPPPMNKGQALSPSGLSYRERLELPQETLIQDGWRQGLANLLMSFPCKYEVSNTRLTIRSGLFTDQARLSSIKQIEPKRSWSTTTALSVDRLELQLEDDTIRQISPKDKQGLLAVLKTKGSATA